MVKSLMAGNDICLARHVQPAMSTPPVTVLAHSSAESCQPRANRAIVVAKTGRDTTTIALFIAGSA